MACGQPAPQSPGATTPDGGAAGAGNAAGGGGTPAGASAGAASSSAGGGGSGSGGGSSSGGGGSGSDASSGGNENGGAAGRGGAATAGAGSGGTGGMSEGAGYPEKSAIVAVLERVNRQFADKWPSPAASLPGSRPSNIWTRAVYFEGLLGLYSASPRAELKSYALSWATFHDWSLRASETNADNQCAGQTYFDLFELDGGKEQHRIAALKASLDTMVREQSSSSWTWVDAIQMSMPNFVRLGTWSGSEAYLEKMHALYVHTRNVEGGGLFDVARGLWWRDAQWKPDKALTPQGKNVYWSRGNGWVFAALARVLSRLPSDDPHRPEYEHDFQAMAEALRARQRADGFWNVSLDDPEHFGGPETTGTSLFTYGMAWGIRRHLLSEEAFGKAVRLAWSGMTQKAVRADGFLGFVQGTGDDPSDGQPLSPDKQPDFEDYGVGCFLLAGSELAALATTP